MDGYRARRAGREVKVPRTRDKSGGHDPVHKFVNIYGGLTRSEVLPRGCAHDAQPFILPLDRVELELQELGDVADKWEDLSHAVVDGCHRREDVDDGP